MGSGLGSCWEDNPTLSLWTLCQNASGDVKTMLSGKCVFCWESHVLARVCPQAGRVWASRMGHWVLQKLMPSVSSGSPMAQPQGCYPHQQLGWGCYEKLAHSHREPAAFLVWLVFITNEWWHLPVVNSREAESCKQAASSWRHLTEDRVLREMGTPGAFRFALEQK